jgi:hypothetical protein
MEKVRFFAANQSGWPQELLKRRAHTKMQPQNKNRFESLSALAPIDAVRAWLAGDFGMGDEPALISAIRQDSRISLSEDDITEVILDAMDNGMDATACLERLTTAKS